MSLMCTVEFPIETSTKNYSHLVKVDFDVRAPILFTVMKGRQVFPVEVFDRATGPVDSGEILLSTARWYQVLKINYS